MYSTHGLTVYVGIHVYVSNNFLLKRKRKNKNIYIKYYYLLNQFYIYNFILFY